MVLDRITFLDSTKIGPISDELSNAAEGIQLKLQVTTSIGSPNLTVQGLVDITLDTPIWVAVQCYNISTAAWANKITNNGVYTIDAAGLSKIRIVNNSSMTGNVEVYGVLMSDALVTSAGSGSSPSPVVSLTTYYGALDSIPVGLSGLSSSVVASDVLLDSYVQRITSGNTSSQTSQYPVFAVPSGYVVTKWCAQGFEVDLPHTLVSVSNYNIYYLNVPCYDVDLGGTNYIFTVEEA